MKQTAVEYLIEQIINNKFSKASEQIQVIEQAKEMEKQQIIDAFKEGYNDSRTPKQYYNETFKNK